MAIPHSMLLLLFVSSMCVMVTLGAPNFSYIKGNVSSTIVNLTGEGNPEDYSFLTNSTEELIFDNATIGVLDLTHPLASIRPWKVVITNSNVTRVLFPAAMSASVVHLTHMGVEDVEFENNTSLQDFRADYTSLQVVSPTVSKLLTLDILWITHSQLTNFSFDVLENSPVSLLYLVGNKIELVTITPGLVCCRNLEELFLSGNQLKRLDFGTMALMSKLKTILLEGNRLAEVQLNLPDRGHQQMTVNEAGDVQTFCSWRTYYIEQEQKNQDVPRPNCTDYFATLLSVHMPRNAFEHIDFGVFRLMNNLNSLDLTKNRLLELVATEEKVPIRLSELFASNNNISDVYLRPFPAMKAIYLYDNNVNTLNMSSLPGELDYLNLVNNPLDCNELPHMNSSVKALGPYTEC
ncbi:uncharacterized protein LOC121598544 [Anopheles merus]|uniref:Leucine rich immune protein (Coil-less) n=1 Tax=Anopheles merus TaxID=30066 RepID=A0A182VK10_ANOME|nr:uncharacterized protein LOC121598544 [Anopheles merus]